MDKPDYNLSNKHQMQRQVDSFAAQTLPGAYRRTHRRQSKNPKRDRGDISFHRLYVEKRVRNVWILQGLDCWEVEKRAKFRVTEGQLWALCVLFLLVSRERSNQATWEKTSVWGVLQHLGWGRISCSGRIMKAGKGPSARTHSFWQIWSWMWKAFDPRRLLGLVSKLTRGARLGGIGQMFCVLIADFGWLQTFILFHRERSQRKWDFGLWETFVF